MRAYLGAMTKCLVLRLAAFTLALLYSAGCDASGPGPFAVPVPAPPLGGQAAERRPSGVPSDGKAREEPAPECGAAMQVPARRLAAEWPQRLGQHVRLSCRVVRAVGITEYLVESDAVPFIVLAAPNAAPCTRDASTFVVMGTARLHSNGRTSVPELAVDVACGG